MKTKRLRQSYAARYFYMFKKLPPVDWTLSELVHEVEKQETNRMLVYVRGCYYDCREQFTLLVRFKYWLRKILNVG